jgi:hypothetical protein
VNGIIEQLEAARKEKAFGLYGLYYYSYSLLFLSVGILDWCFHHLWTGSRFSEEKDHYGEKKYKGSER